MKIWLIEVGEILPVDDGARLMRTGLLANLLSQRGHSVTWWADAFNHLRKSYRSKSSSTVTINPNLELKLLYGPAYNKNVSLARLKNQAQVAREFARLSIKCEKPDIIYCGYPTIELAHEGTKYSNAQNVPLLLDIRDPWPEIFLEFLPRFTHFAAKICLRSYWTMGRETIRAASALSATSDAFLQWAYQFSGREISSEDQVYYLGYLPNNAKLEAVDLVLKKGSWALNAFFVGGFGPAYDLETVLEAARILNKKYPSKIRFVLAGDGPKAAELRARAKGLDNVVFTGWINASQIKYLLQGSDVGLVSITALASKSVPNKSFEYMSEGLAILNSTDGDLKSIVCNECVGMNYAPGNIEKLVECMERLLGEPSLVQRMKENSRRIFKERFHADTVYGLMADRLENMVAKIPPMRH